MTAEIFISFASQDRKVAVSLCSALESRGFGCWLSARDIMPGDNFQISIVQAIRNSKVLILVFTGNSNNSQEMAKELALASQQKLLVIPLRIEDVTPSDAFAYEFATRQWIDCFADWDFAMEQLSRQIAFAIGESGVGEPSVTAVTPGDHLTLSVENRHIEPTHHDPVRAEIQIEPANDGPAVVSGMVVAPDVGEIDPPRRAVNWRTATLVAAGLAAVAALAVTVPILVKPKSAVRPPVIAMLRVEPAPVPVVPLVELQPVATEAVSNAAPRKVATESKPVRTRKPIQAPEIKASEIPY